VIPLTCVYWQDPRDLISLQGSLVTAPVPLSPRQVPQVAVFSNDNSRTRMGACSDTTKKKLSQCTGYSVSIRTHLCAYSKYTVILDPLHISLSYESTIFCVLKHVSRIIGPKTVPMHRNSNQIRTVPRITPDILTKLAEY
jgi:hypothetical protein